MHRLPATAVALVSLLVVACTGGSAVEMPAGEAYARGPIESITHHATASNLLVRAGPGSRERCGISATVDAGTRYLARSAAGALRQIQRSELSVGDTVEVYVDGMVLESCPPQGRASAIVRAARASR